MVFGAGRAVAFAGIFIAQAGPLGAYASANAIALSEVVLMGMSALARKLPISRCLSGGDLARI
jgi:hypothetical protein